MTSDVSNRAASRREPLSPRRMAVSLLPAESPRPPATGKYHSFLGKKTIGPCYGKRPELPTFHFLATNFFSRTLFVQVDRSVDKSCPAHRTGVRHGVLNVSAVCGSFATNPAYSCRGVSLPEMPRQRHSHASDRRDDASEQARDRQRRVGSRPDRTDAPRSEPCRNHATTFPAYSTRSRSVQPEARNGAHRTSRAHRTCGTLQASS